MKLRDVPAIPTIIVAAAVATMIALGVWQLGRAEWKEGLLDRYAAASEQTEVRFPRGEAEAVLYRPSRVNCARITDIRATGARSARGRQGWQHIAVCELSGGGTGEVALGWTLGPQEIAWAGGPVEGIVAPGRDGRGRLVATTPPLDALEPLPRPDPSELPNNHLAYAGQWFFFALTALVIYILAMRSRIAARRDAASPS